MAWSVGRARSFALWSTSRWDCTQQIPPFGVAVVVLLESTGCAVDGINPKRGEILGGSVYSCMLHVWDSRLCNLGNLFMHSCQKAITQQFLLLIWISESIISSHPVEKESALKLVKLLAQLLREAVTRCGFCVFFFSLLLFPCLLASEMQHPLKQPGTNRQIYLREWHTFGAYPFPEVTACTPHNFTTD